MNHRKKCIKNNLVIVFYRGLDPRTRICCLKFFKWLRVRFIFPHKVTIYIMNQNRIKSLHGDKVYGASYFPEDKTGVSIASASKFQYANDYGKNYENLTGILYTIAHEIGHYFEWIYNLDIDIRDLDDEYADEIAQHILELYLKTHEYLYPGAKNEELRFSRSVITRNEANKSQMQERERNIIENN